MSDNVLRAMHFARWHHRNQKRKYTGNPYFDHLAEVAGIAAAGLDPFFTETGLQVAYLHDCMEDQGVTEEQLQIQFGLEVAAGVTWLSDLEKGNRAERKAAARERLARAPGYVQTIKCADIISNTGSIVTHDPNFAVQYLIEVSQLLAVLGKADKGLRNLASDQVLEAQRALLR